MESSMLNASVLSEDFASASWKTWDFLLTPCFCVVLFVVVEQELRLVILTYVAVVSFAILTLNAVNACLLGMYTFLYFHWVFRLLGVTLVYTCIYLDIFLNTLLFYMHMCRERTCVCVRIYLYVCTYICVCVCTRVHLSILLYCV